MDLSSSRSYVATKGSDGAVRGEATRVWFDGVGEGQNED